MVTVDSLIDEFSQFYSTVKPGCQTYAWQRRLIRSVIENGRWPDLIDAPTGAGKTIVLYVHVFLNAMAGLVGPDGNDELGVADLLNKLPRRMVLIVPRRALVDSQGLESAELQTAIGGGKSPLILRVREGLQIRSGAMTVDPQQSVSIPLLVDTVRGGLVKRRFLGEDAWQTHPTFCALIHMTPDMFGSGLLFRNFGSTVGRRPITAGLLGVDTVAVIDEGHLQQQLTLTSRRVVDIDSTTLIGAGILPLQVVSTTATPGQEDPKKVRVRVEFEDFVLDESLALRMKAEKKLSVVQASGSMESSGYVREIVDYLVELHSVHGGPVGFIANSIKSAIAVSLLLKRTLTNSGFDAEGSVLTIVGRMRPDDRIRDVEERFPGVLTAEGNTNVQFIVGTQTLEVGLDIDFSALVTESASSSALAQRFGRVNRKGKRQSEIVVVIPQDQNRSIYSANELTESTEWLRSLGDDASPWALTKCPPNLPVLKRGLLQRLERWDAEFFSNSSERLAAENATPSAGIDHWIRESFDDSLDVSIVVRDLPPDDIMAAELLTMLKPEAEEKLPVTIGIARAALMQYLNNTTISAARYFVLSVDTGRFEPIRLPDEGIESWWPLLAPGQTVVVDSSAPLFLEGVLDPELGKDRLSDVRKSCEARRAVRDAASTKIAHLVLTNLGTEENNILGDDWTSGYSRLSLADSRKLLKFLSEDDSNDHQGVTAESNIRTGENPVFAVLREFASLETEFDPLALDCNTTVDTVIDHSNAPSMAIIVIQVPAWNTNEDLREASSRSKTVSLDSHNRAVAERAAAIGIALKLPLSVEHALKAAGEQHDTGKADRRFQALLRRGRRPDSDEALLAKSRQASWGAEMAFRAREGLSGWRHEQLSAAFAFEKLELKNAPFRDLIIRLVGTSHGFGRTAFKDSSSVLIQSGSEIPEEVSQAAQILFDVGCWETLVEATQMQFGIWGVAYLEALLRAADVTISTEGN